ncbi:related to channel s [Lecanosticta acicola]|uniref:Related to channel s n=1 Tax=Lecanosticta acicola TaxID=111012 RepID=A0AAI8YP45_9PEZI|nr:related to channel s [Lecanosticta acicola]
MDHPRHLPSIDGQTLKGERSGSEASPRTPPNAFQSEKQDTPGSDSLPGEFPNAARKASLAVHGPRKWLGLAPHAELPDEVNHAEHSHLWWSKVKILLKEPFAEMWGTFILVLFGLGGIAQVSLSKNQPNATDGFGYGDWQSICWCFGLGLMLGIYVAGNSGAFLNPAVTLTSCMLRKLPWRRLPLYWIAQFLGAFLAAGVVYANYINGINAVEGHNIRTVTGNTSTAGIFATYPTKDLNGVTGSAFLEQFIASAVLNFVIFALQDDSNKGSFVASGAWFPLGLFFLMFGIAAAFGWQTGFAINPARDFGPRLMSYAVGYGNEVWTADNYYFWIPLVAPFIGCFFGGALYDIFIYTGESPINTPWFGLGDLVNPYKSAKTRLARQRQEEIV